MEERLTSCVYLDGTNGITCHFKGPYALGRRRPTKSILADQHGSPFLQCMPALSANARFTAKEVTQKQAYEATVEGQKACSQYSPNHQ